MAIHNERRKLDYTPQQLFDLVAEVERYPEFLPLWHYVNVSKESVSKESVSKKSVSKDGQKGTEHRVYTTDQVIQLGLLYKRFRTKTILEPYRHIHIVSSDPLFRQFSIDWLFLPCKKFPDKESSEKEEGCQIEFKLKCEASSVFLRPVFDVALIDTARSIVSAFENRARSIYDH